MNEHVLMFLYQNRWISLLKAHRTLIRIKWRLLKLRTTLFQRYFKNQINRLEDTYRYLWQEKEQSGTHTHFKELSLYLKPSKNKTSRCTLKDCFRNTYLISLCIQQVFRNRVAIQLRTQLGKRRRHHWMQEEYLRGRHRKVQQVSCLMNLIQV